MRTGFLIAFLLGAVAALVFGRPELHDPAFWKRQASPGALSAAHARFEDACSTCHTRFQGAEAAKCIVCHASETALLGRQSTAFHASIGACAECHPEHRGRALASNPMNHRALAAIGLRSLKSEQAGSEAQNLYGRVIRGSEAPEGWLSNSSGREALLDCKTCHASKDRHWGLFGSDCAQCHDTGAWTIASYRHPPPSSLDCAECHQAPPSHFMEHFAMISMRVAGQEHADVSQCYLCHQTTSWNDIRSVGVFKHH